MNFIFIEWTVATYNFYDTIKLCIIAHTHTQSDSFALKYTSLN